MGDNQKSRVVEIAWRQDGNYGGREACEVIYELLRANDMARVSYKRPEEFLHGDIGLEYDKKNRRHHVCVQITVVKGDFARYLQAIDILVGGHAFIADAIWHRRTKFPVGGKARFGTVCLGAAPLEP